MKKALITGGSNGLGRAMVDDLLAQGWEVFSLDREAGESKHGLVQMVCDMADRDELDRSLPAILAAGPFNLAVFNAGVSATGRFEDIPFEAYRRLVTVNTEAPMVMAAALARSGALVGHLCLVSSLSHFTGYPGAAVYAASKDALAVYAASVRKPFARRGVSVTLACPGPMRTGHAARHAPEGADEARRMDPAVAARLILAGTLAGRRLVLPGKAASFAALAGRLFPGSVTRRMRKLIFDRLGRSVW